MEIAVFTKDLEILALYLSAATDQTQRVVRTNEILHFAASQGILKVTEFSLERGAGIGFKGDDYGTFNTGTPLGLATIHGVSEIVQYLLEAGADLSITLKWKFGGPENHSSLLQAAAASHQVLSNLLDIVNGYTLQITFADMLNGTYEKFRKCLTKRKIKYTRPLDILDDPENFAVLSDDSDHKMIIKLLVHYDTDISMRGGNGRSVIHSAIFNELRTKAILDYLKNNPKMGIDANTRDFDGRTAVRYAAAECNPDSMELLIESEADITIRDKFGLTALYYALEKLQCTRIALVHGCKVGGTINHLKTPMQFLQSLKYPNTDVVNLLEGCLAKRATVGGLPPALSIAHQDITEVDPEHMESWMKIKKGENVALRG